MSASLINFETLPSLIEFDKAIRPIMEAYAKHANGEKCTINLIPSNNLTKAEFDELSKIAEKYTEKGSLNSSVEDTLCFTDAVEKLLGKDKNTVYPENEIFDASHIEVRSTISRIHRYKTDVDSLLSKTHKTLERDGSLFKEFATPYKDLPESNKNSDYLVSVIGKVSRFMTDYVGFLDGVLRVTRFARPTNTIRKLVESAGKKYVILNYLQSSYVIDLANWIIKEDEITFNLNRVIKDCDKLLMLHKFYKDRTRPVIFKELRSIYKLCNRLHPVFQEINAIIIDKVREYTKSNTPTKTADDLNIFINFNKIDGNIDPSVVYPHIMSNPELQKKLENVDIRLSTQTHGIPLNHDYLRKSLNGLYSVRSNADFTSNIMEAFLGFTAFLFQDTTNTHRANALILDTIQNCNKFLNMYSNPFVLKAFRSKDRTEFSEEHWNAAQEARRTLRYIGGDTASVRAAVDGCSFEEVNKNSRYNIELQRWAIFKVILPYSSASPDEEEVDFSPEIISWLLSVLYESDAAIYGKPHDSKNVFKRTAKGYKPLNTLGSEQLNDSLGNKEVERALRDYPQGVINNYGWTLVNTIITIMAMTPEKYVEVFTTNNFTTKKSLKPTLNQLTMSNTPRPPASISMKKLPLNPSFLKAVKASIGKLPTYSSTAVFVNGLANLTEASSQYSSRKVDSLRKYLDIESSNNMLQYPRYASCRKMPYAALASLPIVQVFLVHDQFEQEGYVFDNERYSNLGFLGKLLTSSKNELDEHLTKWLSDHYEPKAAHRSTDIVAYSNTIENVYSGILNNLKD